MAATVGPGTPTVTRLKLLPWQQVDPSYSVDYHMHTVHTDGTASVQEMAEAAVSKGIDEVLFSEHVRHTSTYYPEFVREVRSLSGLPLTVRVGVETKVLDLDGRLDCSPEIASMCDAIVGSVHSPPPDSQGNARTWSQLDPQAALDLEFQLAMAIAINSQAHILAHPMGMVISRFGLEPRDHLYLLACACRSSGKAFELNTRYCPDPESWVDIVNRAGCKVSFGSDSHRTSDVGSAWHLFRQTGQSG